MTREDLWNEYYKQTKIPAREIVLNVFGIPENIKYANKYVEWLEDKCISLNE